jgi:hypothetical protein
MATWLIRQLFDRGHQSHLYVTKEPVFQIRDHWKER